MLLSRLRRLIIFILVFAAVLKAGAQQTHFIYLQTEGAQPFYVKINNKVISSSPAGYLILSKLPDGEFDLGVGFPKKEFPEENFHISIDKKNQGFLLKNFGEKGWGLFNMQSYAVIAGGNTDTLAAASKILQEDPFSRMLANVVKDSSILEKNEPVKQAPVVAKVDSSVGKTELPAGRPDSNVVKADSVIKTDSMTAREKTVPLLLSPAVRVMNKKDKNGRELVYIDHNQNVNDTIRIFIPVEKPPAAPDHSDTIVQYTKPSSPQVADSMSNAPEQQVSKMKPDTSQLALQQKQDTVENRDTVAMQRVEEKKKPADSAISKENRKAISKNDDIVLLPRVAESSANNSDCKAFASNEDFLRLRKKMASENSDESMIRIAKKSFHGKCFSTEQIKNLSFLFLTNEGKYRFFDLAYPFVADSDQYPTLQSQLTDEYYNNRFKAMIHK